MVKATLDQKATPGEYPYIGVLSNDVTALAVLFTKLGEGTVIAVMHGTVWNVGDHKTGWAEDKFKRMEGKLVLEND